MELFTRLVFAGKANATMILFLLFALSGMMAKAQCDTPPDQDFGTDPQSPTYPPSLTHECVTYTGSDAGVYIDDAVDASLTTSPAFSGNALLIYGNTEGGYASIYTESGNEFSMVAFNVEFYGHSNGGAAEHYNIVGYKNSVVTATVTNFVVTTSGVYGSGTSTVNWTRLDFDEFGSNSGTLGFTGTDWQDVDEIRFETADVSGTNYLYLALDNLDFEPANTLGIKDETEFGIKLFPNPTSGHFTIDSGNLKIEEQAIYNSLGKLVYEAKDSAQTELQPDLENGVYFLKIKMESGQTATHKLVISK